jgi:sec-independent protein translocase protein TatC
MNKTSPKSEVEVSEPSDTQSLPRMGIGEHFAALRVTLARVVAFLFVGIVISFSFLREIWTFLLWPLPANTSLVLSNLTPSEPLLADFKVALWSGAVLSSPFWLWQIWSFFAPALYARQKSYFRRLILGSLTLFAMGTAFAHFVVAPLCLKFFYNYSAGIAEANWRQSAYLDFVLQMLLTFGIVFQMPVLCLALNKMGFLTGQFLRDQWRLAVLIIFIAAALLSPPDVLSQTLLAIPMCGLYLLSVLLVAWSERSEARRQAKSQE